MKISGAKQYIEAIRKFHEPGSVGYRYFTWILENGEVFTEKTTYKKDVPFEIEPNGCYHNSQLLVMFSDEKIDYVEGWAISDIGIPIEHAVVAAGDKVIDLTWDAFDIKGIEYFGVRIPKEFVIKHIYRNVNKYQQTRSMLFCYFEETVLKRDKK